MNTCNYNFDRLQPYIFIFGSNLLKIKVNSISFASTSGLNRRYSFTHQLTVAIDGIDFNLTQLLMNHEHIGFEDYSGVVYKMNPEIPYEVSYNISYEDNRLSTTYTIGIRDNTPYEVFGFEDDVTEIESVCAYSAYNIKNVYINLYDYTRISETTITYINGHEFEKLDYIENSLSFTSQHQFNGKTNDEVTFLVEDDEQEYLPFFDNSFVLAVQFSDGRYVILGANNGLEANYDTALSSNDNGNRTVQLKETYDSGRYIKLYDFSFVQLSDFHYEYIKYGSICSENNGYAQYILKQKYDDFGNAYNDYLALEGYEEEFPDLNITGTFDNVETFESKECYVEPAYVNLSNSTLIFHEQYESQKIIVDANCDWSLRSLTGITFTPNSGTTGTTEVTITNNYTVPQFGLFVIYCDYDMKTEIIGNIGVQKMPLDDVFPMGSTYEYDYQPQIAHIPTNYVVTSISSDYNKGRIWYENNFINIELFYNDESTNAYSISATTKYGTYVLGITQYQQYIDWRETTQTGCDANGDLCVIEQKYVSTDDELYVPTQEERFGRVIESGYCSDWEEREVVTDSSYCDGSNSWRIIEVQRSNDNWTTYEVIDNILGEWLGECQATLTYSWEQSTKIGKWNNRDCYLYIKTFFNQDTHVGGAVVPFTFSPDGTAGELPIIWVVD